MDSEEQLSKKIEDYQELYKENKNIDVTALMLNALNTQKQNVVSSKQKRWAYSISLGFPPLGLFFAAKYYFGEEDDARHVGNMCIILTIVSVIMLLLSFKFFASSSGVSMDQLQQIKPSDVMQLSQ